MVSPAELNLIEVFRGVTPTNCERFCRKVADISVQPGEYVVREGEPRALYGILEGAFEVVKVVEGSERVFGRRSAGQLFGELTVVFGMPQAADLRAVEPSRIVRIEPHDYYALAADVPELAERVGKRAAYRMGGPGGVQALLSRMDPVRAVVLGGRHDAACAELRRFLDRNEIRFEWLDPEVPADLAKWSGTPSMSEDYPVLRVVDGKTVARPTLRRAAELLGLSTEPAAAEYDTVVIGAGPAGLAAAVYGASEGLSTLVIEREAPGGQAGTSSRIENYLGFPSGVSGGELSSRALRQAHRLGAEILVTRAVDRIRADGFYVYLDGGDVLRTRSIILACGVSWRHLAIEGFDRLIGKGIFYGAARSEASNTHGLDIHIIGAGNSAGQAAMFFSTYAQSVTILCRGDSLGKSMSQYLVDQLATRPNIHVLFRTQATAAHGGSALEALDIRNDETGETTREACGGLFIFIGADAETGWLPPEIALDAKGYVLTGHDVRNAGHWSQSRDPYLLETSVPGIFACGDVRCSPVKRVAAAVGEGSMAIAFVHQYLSEQAGRSGDPNQVDRAGRSEPG